MALALATLGLIASCDQASGGPAAGLEARPVNTTCKPPPSINQPARLLSETGCLDRADPRKPGPALIPYDVASPLWSDGADKERYLALPEGGRITAADEHDGHWDLPVGTVLVKAFRLGGRFVETRLLVRFDQSTWKGYGYEWNEAQTDATLVDDNIGGVKKAVPNGAGMQTWHFPSRAQCLQCHHEAAGISLGPTTAQMNRDLRYPNGVTANQIDTLAAIGVFERAPRQPYAAALAAPGAAALSVERRARSYLHANCANCHRPLGSFEGIDLREHVPFAATGLCNAPPEKGEVGVPGALLLVPGQPARSLMSIRMHVLGDGRMPQIGTSVVDPEGVALIDQWITGIAACP